MKLYSAAAIVLLSHVAESFVSPTTLSVTSTLSSTAEPLVESSSNNFISDPLLVDPMTKEPLSLSLKGPILGSNAGVRLTLKSASDSERVFEGRSDSYINLLEPIKYIPMRDLFTDPSVSFATKEDGDRADKEFDLAKEYFAPVIDKKRSSGENNVVVDMSCATGLFTRQARRRIRADSDIASSNTQLDLVRCDVAKIPFKSDSIDAFHAGAAMHCWPEIEESLKEIHRVLVPGGRYFASTFLGTYFQNVANLEKTSNGGSDVEPRLRDLLLNAGFDDDKVDVEVIGAACVIIRCEK
ncbi:methyltransferase [Skeletonema marinoi]|uniref:Methyltransferase n=1 Tax=Skeletonema marinoi TaxID=267567 RepID=A0AAD8YF30_9STRA|nr:methyltransferase [Skeletonema marinoi]